MAKLDKCRSIFAAASVRPRSFTMLERSKMERVLCQEICIATFSGIPARTILCTAGDQQLPGQRVHLRRLRKPDCGLSDGGLSPDFSVSVDPATNRSKSWSYDANGSPGFYLNENVYGTIYDVENRLVNWTGPRSYDPSGKRVTLANSSVNDTLVYFYGITGQRLGTYTLASDGSGFSTTSLDLYFGSKLMRSAGLTVATDRLGSVRANMNGALREGK